jgi:uncharacterized protein YdiU (UPF0061 family)
MKMRLPAILFFIFSLQLFSCSNDRPEDREILAKINDFYLTLNEFQYKLSDELEMERDFKLTKEARDEFLNDIIRKELLIQEAKKMELDKEEKFMRTIESYWEATLIRDLMEKKGMEISETIIVSQDEINNYYNSLKKTRPDLPPLESMEEAIIKDLKERKKTEKLREWIDSLQKNADIDINKELLYKN